MKSTIHLSRLVCALAFVFSNVGLQVAGALDLTIITHGLQFDNSYPSWIDAMATAVEMRTGNANTATIYAEVGWNANNHLGVTQFHLQNGQWPGSNTPTEHVVIKLLWHTVAGITDSVDTGMVADKILPYLITPLSVPGWGTVPALVEAPIHLIGHSRGGSLVAAVTGRLAQHGIWVDHLTTLDPHPINSDESVVEYSNVRFADNYYQIDSTGLFPISGNSVPGTIQINLTALFDSDPINDGGNFSDHIEVHDWYFGTVDEKASTVAGDPIPRSYWYSSFNTGFQFALVADGQRLRETPELGAGIGLATQGALRAPETQPIGTLQYPSIELLNTNWTYDVYEGTGVPLLIRYEGAPGINSAVVTVGLSRTLNPYLPFDSTITSTTNGAVGSQKWQGVRTWVPKLSDDGKYIFARISTPDGTSRYFYIPRPYHVVPPPTVAIVGLSPGAGITLEVRSIAGRIFHLQHSSNLHAWNDLFFGINDDGNTQLVDSATTSERVGFYRVLVD